MTKGGKAMTTTERIRPMGGMFGQGMVGQKAMNFGPSLRRILGMLAPHRAKVALVIAFGVVSVALSSVGPRVLGRATDLIFGGIVGRQFPAGLTKEQVVEGVREAGNTQVAEMLARMDLTPGQGVDFGAVGQVLLIVTAIYLAAALLGFLQGYLLNDVVQATVYRLRAAAEEKLNRLPLQYFDKQPRGELLSRVTNDIDNVSQSLQQTLSQVLSSLLTVVFVLIMMFTLSPVLTLVALASIPATMVVAVLVMSRSGKQFVAQWRHTGALNAHVEEAFTGHALVKVFGRQREVQASFEQENQSLFEAGFKAQFLSGLIMPAATFIGNLNYALIAVVGGLRVANGTISLGDVQAFIQYSRQFTQPVTQLASMTNLLQSGVASAERVFELLDADEEIADEQTAQLATGARGHVTFEHVSFRYEEDRPLIEDLSLEARPGQTVAIVGPTGAGKTTLVNLLMRFYELDAGRITLDGVDIASMPRAELRSQVGMVLQDT
ncbi:MAG TPA: ABC transporter ATP-binding protein, partial [Trueperaceae bacterium]|nr:ABC transporter ATP-binding protein [Trueperaceae bacterium]